MFVLTVGCPQTFTKLMNHSTVDPLPDRYTSYEEAYHFRSDPRDVNCTVLLSYDPSTVDDPKFGTRPYYEGTPPPIAWFREGQPTDLSNGTAATGGVMPGRTWMTSLGHTIEIWKDPTHLAHVEAGSVALHSAMGSGSLTGSVSRHSVCDGPWNPSTMP